VLLLGAGGAARAVALALGRKGARVSVAARKADAAVAAAALAGGEAVAWNDRAGVAEQAEIVVNATPIGMGGDDALPVPASSLRADHVVVDLVYHPIETPLLTAAAACGAAPVDGLGMLVHQAALQVECWSGREPPVAVMRAAAQAALATR
jgi:shikimate dehydrogenase